MSAFAQNGAAFGEESSHQKRREIIGRRFGENNSGRHRDKYSRELCINLDVIFG
jgi:hypothetical protein